jgi:succinate dehydrogenase / fumarate reductase cytochrome b subunit
MGAEASWTAASGLLLVLFLVAHLAGVALAPLAPAAFETYAAGLHAAIWLPAAELALLGVALSHASLGVAKAIANRRAGNTASLVSRRGTPLAALAARTQAIGGVILLGFLGVHLGQLRWSRPSEGLERAALQAVLAQPQTLVLYLAAALAVALHLFHGGEAAHRSLGLLDPANGQRIRVVGRMLALVVGGGFMAVTLALALQLSPASGALP